MSAYDVVVLGAGPGGYVAAIRAAQLGLKTAIVEERYWGGVCLNVGCIPSKALLRNAELAHIFMNERKTYGIEVEGEVRFDYGQAFQRSRKVADGRVKGVHYLMKKNNITQLEGVGEFVDANTLRVVSAGGGTETVTFTNAIIATGATPRLLPGTQLSDRVVTYESQIMSDTLPARIVIAGAGAIGVEFAYVLHNFGVKVTIVEFADRMVPMEDEDVSKELIRHYRKLGIEVRTGTRVVSVEEGVDSVRVVVDSGKGPETIETDKVLQAIGFAPRVEGYGLGRTGVKLTDRGAIEVDGRCRTSTPHIFAIGDVTAKLMLAHTAEAMGVIAAETIGQAPTMELDYIMIPRATYCQPQIASFGYTEAQARAKGLNVRVAKFPFSANGKAHGLGDTVGFVKLISDAGSGELLGGHLIGPEVTELLPELTMAQMWEATVSEIARNVHAHPTLGEAVKEAVHGLAGHMINM
ncbi:dihydrolipoyl dehydrogenase [Catellatospora citrea]|uniref:dihydrolipoyl dehydrogenase n=1 Tax=Catellatospora citrea TaxID=53366 RepID=UPI0033D585DD